MGRLTLNVLLSFAQFEREVTSERIRDKIAASKRKGLWVGGMVPLGYDAKDRRIWVNEEEAERVRIVFRRYLELGSLAPLLGDLRRQGIVTKLRTLKTGRTVGGVPFTRGGLAYLLRNRFYVGEVAFKGEVLPGEQPTILDRELFDAVQAKLSQQKTNHQTWRTSSNALLMGRLFDDRGHGMTPSHTCKQGVRYRYYLSSALLQGQQSGSVRRVAATEIENLVIQSVRDHVKPPEDIDDRGLVQACVARVEIRRDQLIVELNQTEAANGSQPEDTNTLHIPWSKTLPTRRCEILLPADPSRQHRRPIRSDTRGTVIAAIAQGRRWLKELIEDPDATTETIATRAECSVRKVNMTISLAFLTPDLVKAAIDGQLPQGLGIARLCDLPIEWARQREILGLAAY
jgi:DNA-binding PadR family transcriptional regulator